MAIPDEQIRKVMAVLTEWNPLGARANTIRDLDNYRTEAVDILVNLSISAPIGNPAVVVQEVINQAFDLSLSIEDCVRVSRKIQELLTVS
jgi:hypothetical protein